MDINALERQDVPILRWLAGGWCPIVLSGSGLEQFQEKCDRFFPGKARSAFPWELRKNKEIERFAVSVKQ